MKWYKATTSLKTTVNCTYASGGLMRCAWKNKIKEYKRNIKI